MTRDCARHRVRPLAAGLLLLAAAACGGGSQQEDEYLALPPSSFAGMKAGMTCSAVFVSGRTLKQVLAHELSGLPDGANATADPVVDRGSVRVTFAPDEPPRIAVFRPGAGCTVLAPGATLEDARRLPRIPVLVPPGDPARIPWPDGDLLPDSPPDWIDQGALNALVETAFDGETYGDGTRTIGIAVVHRGRLVAERYGAGFGPHTPYRTWSAAKTITNALIGILVGRRVLDVDDPAPIPEWQSGDDPRAEITIENLLHMSSGLERRGSGAYPAYYDGANAIEEITRAPLEVEPGTRWSYANRDTLLLVRAIRHVLGNDAEYWALPRLALLHKIGMRSTIPETDAHGNFILSSQVFSTARDLARFGLLYLNDGLWKGRRILPKGWVEYSTRPAPAKSTGLSGLVQHGLPGLLGYGAQLWLYPRIPVYLPFTAYSAIGHRGQYVTVVKSHDLVVVRTGLDPEVGGVLWRQDRLVKDVIATVGG